MSSLPRATVTESADGEISCSVDETNRIRIALGLRPLDVGGAPASSSSSSDAPTFVDLRAEADNAARASAVAARIERARREREEAAAVRAKSLGESLTAKGALSAADWVAQSRQQAARAAAARPAAAAASSSSSSSSSSSAVHAGLRIRHDVDSFKGGSEGMVLTLADTGLLDGEGRGLADEEADLVNVDVADRERAEDRNERKRKAHLPVYSGADDSEFGAGAGAGGGAVWRKSILSHYDEEDDERERRRARLVIRADGTVEDTEAPERARARAAAAQQEHGRVDIGSGGPAGALSSDAPALGMSSDFLTKAEIMASVIPKPKKKKKLRKAGAEDDAEGQGAVAAAAATGAAQAEEEESIRASASDRLVAEIHRQTTQLQADGAAGAAAAAAGADVSKDRGSRAARRVDGAARLAEEDAAARAAGHKAFDVAVARATQRTAALLGRPGEAPAATSTPALGAGWDEVGASTAPRVAGPPKPRVAVPLPPTHAGGAAGVSAVSKQRIYTRLRADGDGDGGSSAAAAAAAAEDGDDAELQAALARARRQRRTQEAADAAAATAAAAAAAKGEEVQVAIKNDPAARITALLASYNKNAAPGGGMEVEGGGGAEGEGGEEGGGLVYSAVSEFSGRLQAELLGRDDKASSSSSSSRRVAAVPAVAKAEAVDGGAGAAASSSSSSSSSARPHAAPRRKRAAVAASGGAGGGWEAIEGAAGEEEDMEVDDVPGAGAGGDDVYGDDGGEDYGEEDEDDEDDEEEGGGRGEGAEGSATASEVHLNKGAGAALLLFQRAGSLAHKDDRVGRAKDARPDWSGDGAAGDAATKHIKLEYTDDQGRKLTPKEAYRQLSYRFHGRAPSKSVLDKRLKRLEREKKLTEAASGDTPLGSLAALQKAQEARGQAFVTLAKK
jgi:hypothetical protein